MDFEYDVFDEDCTLFDSIYHYYEDHVDGIIRPVVEQAPEPDPREQMVTALYSRNYMQYRLAVTLGVYATMSTSTQAMYVCGKCGKSFEFASGLRSHSVVHETGRPYGCDKCTKKFKTQYTLNQHKAVHNDPDSYRCKICKKGFKRESYVERHMREFHYRK